MEFKFDVNNLFPHEITKLDHRMVPPVIPVVLFPGNSHENRQLKLQLAEVVDKLGEASAKAQGLHGPITSSQKLGLSDHHLYILKDLKANNGFGAAIGLLKTGRKRLFIYDRDGGQHEVEPLCVLDFYIHESRQRMGCGRRLFQHMLQEEGVKPYHLAVDRPSHKFLTFLQKHYQLKASIPQVNNFVVFDSFFRDKPPELLRRKQGCRPPLHPYSRHLREPECRPQGDFRPDSERSASSLSIGRQNREYGRQSTSKVIWSAEHNKLPNCTHGRPGSHQLGPADRPNSRSMGARHNMYSRHALRDSATPPYPPADVAGSHYQPVEEKSTRSSSPPLLNRDGPSTDFMQLKNTVPCSDYLEQRSHSKVGLVGYQANLKCPDNSPPKKEVSSLYKQYPGLPLGDPYTTKSARPLDTDTGWNVFGLPSGGKDNCANRKHQHTKLW